MGLTAITPECQALGPWHTLSVANWDDEATVTRTITLREIGLAEEAPCAVFEFHDQTLLGLKGSDDPIELEIPPHGTRLLRIAPYRQKPLIVGTDLHFSGGGCELAEVTVGEKEIRGQVHTRWDYPVVVSAIWPAGRGVKLTAVTVPAGQKDFILRPDR
jgi:hypothetical protein